MNGWYLRVFFQIAMPGSDYLFVFFLMEINPLLLC